MTRRLRVWVILLFGFLGGAGSAADESVEPVDPAIKLLEALRARKLDRLLETHAARLLRTPDLDSALAASLTLELTRILSRRGAESADDGKREALWNRADRLFADFSATNHDDGKIPLYRYRFAGQLLQRAQRMSDLAQLTPENPAPKTSSTQAARHAVKLLDQVNQTLERELDQRDRDGKANRNGLRADQLASLATATEFRLGAAWLAVARAETDEALRDEAIHRSEQLLERYSGRFSNLPIVLESHLALAELYRIAEEPDEAIAVLRRLENPETPPAVLRRSHLLLGSLLLDSGQVADALALLDVPREQRTPGAMWELRLFEALLRSAADRREEEPDEADRVQRRALTLLDSLERDYGSYWSRRGERTLLEYADLASLGADPSFTRRLANLFRGRKKYPQALESYDRVLRIALDRNDGALAAEMAYAGGAVAYEMGDFPQAAARLEKVAEQHPGDPLAPRAMLMAASALARQNAATGEEALLERYRRLLNEQLRRYGEDVATASEAHWMLAELADRTQDLDEATRHYRAVPASSPRYAASLQAVANIYHDRLVLGSENAEAARIEQAIEHLESALDAPSGPWSAVPVGARAIGLARFVLARLLMTTAIGRDDDAVALLRDHVVGDPALSAELRNRGWQTLLETHLRRGEVDPACAVVRAGFGDDARPLLAVLTALDPEDHALDETARALQVAVIQAACERLFPEAQTLSPADRTNLRLLQARAFSAADEHETAQRLLRQLRAEAPKDPRILMSLAANLRRQRKFRDSLRIWERLLKGLRRGSSAWLQAMANAIACHIDLGDRDAARKLLDATRTLYPRLDDPRLREKFAQLDVRLKEQP